MIVNIKSGEIRVKWMYPHKHSKHRSSTHCRIYTYTDGTETIIATGASRCHTDDRPFTKIEGRYHSLVKALDNLKSNPLITEADVDQIREVYKRTCKFPISANI